MATVVQKETHRSHRDVRRTLCVHWRTKNFKVQGFKLTRTHDKKHPTPRHKGKMGAAKGSKDWAYFTIIGDSMSYHHGHNAKRSGGIASHLSRRIDTLASVCGNTGNTGGAFDRLFKYQMRGKTTPGTWPKVVILTGMLQHFATRSNTNKKTWILPPEASNPDESNPEAAPSPSPAAHLTGTFIVKLSEVAPLPNPDKELYESATLAARAVITTGSPQGKDSQDRAVGHEEPQTDAQAQTWKRRHPVGQFDPLGSGHEARPQHRQL